MKKPAKVKTSQVNEFNMLAKSDDHKHSLSVSSFAAVANLVVALVIIVAAQQNFGCDALRMINLDIPETPLAGSTIRLSCTFKLEREQFTSTRADGWLKVQKYAPENLLADRHDQQLQLSRSVGALGDDRANFEQLYAIKWYKDEREFFRYLAQEKQRKQSLPMEGVQVNVEQSDNHTIELRNISLKTSGQYRCEVSTDAPTFITKSMERVMQVYSIPNQGPEIELTKGSGGGYFLGDRIELSCLAPESKPPTQLDWILNDALNLSASLDSNQKKLLKFSVQNQQFVRLPSISSINNQSLSDQLSSTTNANKPKTFTSVSSSAPYAFTIYELLNKSMAIPRKGEFHQPAPINLANALYQLQVASSTRLNLTVDTNLLQFLTSLAHQPEKVTVRSSGRIRITRASGSLGSDGGERDQFSGRATGPGHNQTAGSFVALKSNSIQVLASPEVHVRALVKRSKEQIGKFALVDDGHNPNAFAIASTPYFSSSSNLVAGLMRTPKLSAPLKQSTNRVDNHKLLELRISCVSTALHLVMSDEIKFKIWNRPRDTNGMPSSSTVGAQKRQKFNEEKNSGEQNKSPDISQLTLSLLTILVVVEFYHQR